MNKIKIVGIIAILIFIAFTLNFTGLLTLKKENNNIKIGAMLYLTGEGSTWGDASYKGIELAIDEINKKGGIDGRKIEVIYQDTKGDLKETLTIYQKFRDIEKVTAIIGPNFQSEMSVITPLLKKDNIPVIAPSYVSKDNRNIDYNPLLIWQDPTLEAEKIAKYIYNKNISNMAVIGTLDTWEKEVSTSFKNKFIELGGNIVYFELINPYEFDISTLILKAINKNPEGIFIGSYFIFIDATKKIYENNYTGELFSIEVDDYLAKESKNYSQGVTFISPDLYSNKFIQDYYQKYNTKTTLPSGQAYDSAKILLSILEKTTNKEEIIKEFSKLEKYDGVSGEIIFENGKTSMPLAIFQIDNGEIKKIENID